MKERRKRLVILPIAIALVATGALAAYISTWWTVTESGGEIHLLATIFVLGAVAVMSMVYWVAAQSQAISDERYRELKALAEKVADAVTQSSGDARPAASADPGHATLAQELAEMRSAITRIERLAAREGEAYLSGYMARAAEEEGQEGPPLVA